MKGRQVVLGQHKGVQIACLLANGILHDAFYEHPNTMLMGSILRGIVDRPIKGMGGAMVRLQDGGMGFLRKAAGLPMGQVITVQISGYAEGGKAVPVTQRILFKSRYCIVTPNAPGVNISRQIKDDDKRDELHITAKAALDGAQMGLIIRSAAEHADVESVMADIETMAQSAQMIMGDTAPDPQVLLAGEGPHELAWCQWADVDDIRSGDTELDECGVIDQLIDLQQSYVPLGQGHMYIEPTRALTAVDVNTGADTSPAAALKINLAAVKQLPRQLRLRGLGGQITVDFAPLSKRDRRTVEVELRRELRACPVETEFVGWTPLGHAELKRKRERIALNDVFAQGDFE